MFQPIPDLIRHVLVMSKYRDSYLMQKRQVAGLVAARSSQVCTVVLEYDVNKMTMTHITNVGQ